MSIVYFLEFLCVIIYTTDLASCYLTVNDTESNTTVARCNDAESNFGGKFYEGTLAYLINSYPVLACNNTIDPPPIYLPNSSNIIFVALIKRGICTFAHKIRSAQRSGYQGVIIYNNDNDNFFSMPKPAFSRDIHIPSRMVGRGTGNLLKQYCFTLSRQQFIMIFGDDSEFNPTIYIIAFLSFVSLGFIIIGLGFAIKLCRDCVKRRANRLKKSHLKKIPIKKFIKGEDSYEMCAICLEDFVDGDKLRILPCNHAYHMKCIDPWLLKQKRNCPVCKSRVTIPGREEESDDSSSVTVHSEAVNISVDEHTPLMDPRATSGSQSYFSNIEAEINFVPEPFKPSTQNCYENPCVHSGDNSIDVIVIGMSINNDEPEIGGASVSHGQTPPHKSDDREEPPKDLNQIV